MKEVHAPMTGLEEKFEEELGNVPTKRKLTPKKGTQPKSKTKVKDSRMEKKIEEAMQLGR